VDGVSTERLLETAASAKRWLDAQIRALDVPGRAPWNWSTSIRFHEIAPARRWRRVARNWISFWGIVGAPLVDLPTRVRPV
jgi:hypothetical protein